MAKLADVALILKRLSAAYGQPVSEDQARAYHAVLGEFPRLVLVAATAEVMGKSKFFPRPAEILPIAAQIGSRWRQPDDCQFDEAGKWVCFKRNYTSTDELTEGDIAEVYQEMARGAPAWMTREMAVAHV